MDHFQYIDAFRNEAFNKMLMLLSPAKTQDFIKTNYPFKNQPLFIDKVTELVSLLKTQSPQALESVLKISPKLAALNFDRYMHFDSTKFSADNSKACIFAYQGDVYQSLKAENFSPPELEFAQDHLLILSALYGALRPLDAIQPYRLEMTAGLKIPSFTNLYHFWQATLTEYLNTRLKTNPTLINLSSQEYSKMINTDQLIEPIIQISFQDWHATAFKTIGLFAKKARGWMARYIIENKISRPVDIKNFNLNGYYYAKSLSSEKHYIFQRKI